MKSLEVLSHHRYGFLGPLFNLSEFIIFSQYISLGKGSYPISTTNIKRI